jgi:hypothetical protein
MQTECAPRRRQAAVGPDCGFATITGTEDGLAKYPYIRESRRIRAEFTVLEQHVGTEARMKLTGKPRELLTAESLPIHGGHRQLPHRPASEFRRRQLRRRQLAALPDPNGRPDPRRMENLLAACKNLGVTHITNGCYRLHPVEWNIGESAGQIAAEAVKTGHPPRKIRNDKKLLSELQARMAAQGIELAWPKPTPR